MAAHRAFRPPHTFALVCCWVLLAVVVVLAIRSPEKLTSWLNLIVSVANLVAFTSFRRAAIKRALAKHPE